ncbi:MAG: hypothetical protein HYV40_01810 [Candidatus Levybacteria bacterium]|nr:hypothetical protein [Candidatus Levybacteria bacterium]
MEKLGVSSSTIDHLSFSLTRRQLAPIIAGITLGTGSHASVAQEPTPQASPEASPVPQPTAVPELTKIPEGSSYEITLGSEVEILQSVPGLSHFPDTHTSILPLNEGAIAVYLSGAGFSYRLTGPDIFHLKPLQNEKGFAKPLLLPDYGAAFGKNYRGFGSVLPGRTPDERIGIFHAEEHIPSNAFFKASIGIALSKNNGYKWDNNNVIQIIRGRNEAQLQEPAVSGAGQPSAVIIKGDQKDDQIYLYYIDWSAGPGQYKPTGIHLAQAPLADCTNPDAWEKHIDQDFKNGGLTGESTPVVLPPDPMGETGYAALPSVSFNEALNKYLMVFETNIGFYYTDSSDGITWSEGKVLMPFTKCDDQGSCQPFRTQQRQSGDTWYSYPTLVTPHLRTDQTTWNTGMLLCSKGVEGDGIGHHMVGFAFEIKAK